ncbi:MAG: nucleotidyltransferase domain-containing protein [Acidobacteria bacterium]|nr:nucleotidyltransferase domain-containing protein [Acidobacteriota bacterium]
MSLYELLNTKKDAIAQLAREYGASNIRVFGSVARGDETPESDIDLLVDMDLDRSLFDQITLKQEMEAFGRKGICDGTPQFTTAPDPERSDPIMKEAICVGFNLPQAGRSGALKHRRAPSHLRIAKRPGRWHSRLPKKIGREMSADASVDLAERQS